MSNHQTCVDIDRVSHSYGERLALDAVTFQVAKGEIFGLLGPNGGGKTTLFRVLSTLVPLQKGAVRIASMNISDELFAIRRRIGVVFQAPSLDKKLSVEENLVHQGHLHGLCGKKLKDRIHFLLDQVRVRDRSNDLVENLSGGLQRRVEIAKGLLHEPEILLLDEPSTGLDPGARRDMWTYLETLNQHGKVTILVTTHLMEEAEKCHRIGILNEGRLIALDSPDALKATIGGTVITVRCRNAAELLPQVRQKFGGNAIAMDDVIRMEHPKGAEFVARLVEAFPGRVDAVTVSRPTLEDVFIHKTGHRFWNEDRSHE